MSKIYNEIKYDFNCICFKNSQQGEEKIPNLIKNNDLVLVKGSNSMNLNLITLSIINFFKKLNSNKNIHPGGKNYAV